MESRNVKIIDDKAIDRTADVICGFSIDNSKYVLYSIERDNENDNLFVSKLTDNIDGTSNMQNIDDSAEKGKVDNVAKELIKHAINNEADTLPDNVITLLGGEVHIDKMPLFNKEQKIDVGHTYISTVKKSVTKVSEEFYKVDDSKVEESSIFETVNQEIFNPQELKTDVSVQEEPVPEESTSENLQEPILPVEPLPEEPKVDVLEPEIQPTLDVPTVDLNPVNTVPEGPVLPVEPLPEESKVNTFTQGTQPVLSEPSVELNSSNEVNKEAVQEEPVSENLQEPLLPINPIPSVISPVEPSVGSVNQEPTLLFDGKAETNLNNALGEISEEKTMVTEGEGVHALRQFGSDEPVLPPEENAPVDTNVKTLTRSKGFANNKFFMVIAIAFFVAACVFLGYEAFQYFQIIK